jgi:hypothetical protein
MSNEPANGLRTRPVIGVEDDDDFPNGDGEACIERCRLAACGSGGSMHAGEGGFTPGKVVEQPPGGVGGAIVDDDDVEPISRIVDGEEGTNETVYYGLFVLARDEDADARKLVVGHVLTLARPP